MPHSNSEMIWKQINGYEGLYEISNNGKVKSLSRYAKCVSHNKPITRLTSEHLLTPTISLRGKQGYPCVTLSKNGVYKRFLIHRLVAQAFIPNPNNLPCVNHKDENPLNNNVENLEWCTYAYNNCYGTRNKRISEAKKGKPGMKGEINPNYGKHFSEETKHKMSEAAKRRCKRNASQ